MSTPSFSEDEKRFLLAEIIKNSRVSINTLLGIIKREHISPNWQEIYFPSARNLKTCKAVFEELMSSSLVPLQPPSNFEPTPRPTLKRRLSDTEPTPGLARPLHPKPAANGAQFVPSASLVEPTAKKRGRPTKEVLDARRAEAASRGTIYPPLKAAAGRKSMGESPMSQQSLGSQGPASEPGPKTGVNSESPLAKKRRGRPAKDTIGQREILEPAPHTMGIPEIVSVESKDVGHPNPDILEDTARLQNLTPSVVAVGATPQESPASIQTQTIGSIPTTQP